MKLMIFPGGNELAAQQTNGATVYTTELLDRRCLSDKTFEIKLARPPAFQFEPGQRIRLIHENIERDYSLISAPGDSHLALCIRRITGGAYSSLLADARISQRLCFSGPHGYFLFHPSGRPAVFIATGTGIAPFCAMARSGLNGFTLLHGIRSPDERYYASLFRSRAKLYVACLSAETPLSIGSFRGRVTAYLKINLPVKPYDFYLCGRSEMIRDAISVIDDRFKGSLVYTEIFY
jgi:benzoate/toluate 1,2-dioxygenase reductase subunit